LLTALAAAGLAPSRVTTPDAGFDDELAGAVQLYLARSASALAVLQLEDLLGMSDPVNVPGTLAEYPNWQRKLSATLDDLFNRESALRLLAQVRTARSPKFGSEPI
jgi:4-alpha-glucanotransferase